MNSAIGSSYSTHMTLFLGGCHLTDMDRAIHGCTLTRKGSCSRVGEAYSCCDEHKDNKQREEPESFSCVRETMPPHGTR